MGRQPTHFPNPRVAVAGRRPSPEDVAMEHFDPGDLASSNPDFRRVLWTGTHTQLVLMTVPVGEEIGAEVHEHNDQILSFVSGVGAAVVAGETRPVTVGDVVAVPAGTEHNFLNTGTEPLVLTTVYGPPDHPPSTVHHTKAEADAAEHDEH
jgi:mannose-6-phosphate isomerase-like protein (cupin superfamily)